MTNDQAAVIANEVKHLTEAVREMKEQNEQDHREVRAELKAINTRLTSVEMWRERIKGALFSVPALVSLAVTVVSGIILYVLTGA